MEKTICLSEKQKAKKEEREVVFRWVSGGWGGWCSRGRGGCSERMRSRIFDLPLASPDANLQTHAESFRDRPSSCLAASGIVVWARAPPGRLSQPKILDTELGRNTHRRLQDADTFSSHTLTTSSSWDLQCRVKSRLAQLETERLAAPALTDAHLGLDSEHFREGLGRGVFSTGFI